MKLSNQKEYGDRIKAERRKLNLYQKDVARLCHKSKSIPGRWENGQLSPTIQALENLYHLGFDIIYILTGIKTK